LLRVGAGIFGYMLLNSFELSGRPLGFELCALYFALGAPLPQSIRKGCAFPRGSLQTWEAMPLAGAEPQIPGEQAGKAEPFRTEGGKAALLN
jgi:hypothetical protein